MKAAHGLFLGAYALTFFTSAAGTIAWSSSMSAANGMPMPGGWTMSMAWMRMPDQSWAGAAATFVGMWAAMMPAMMLPSLAPVLWRYRQAMAAKAHPGLLVAIFGAGYFAVWAALGAAIYPVGVALAEAQMRSQMLARAVPLTAGATVFVAGALQLTGWKARQLGCCREARESAATWPADAGSAWRHGLRLGVRCTACCVGPTAILLAIGVMDLRAMAVVTAAVTFERLAPAAGRAARTIGILAMAAGLALITRAAGIA
jgi:predicted metal-binding membrane protein